MVSLCRESRERASRAHCRNGILAGGRAAVTLTCRWLVPSPQDLVQRERRAKDEGQTTGPFLGVAWRRSTGVKQSNKSCQKEDAITRTSSQGVCCSPGWEVGSWKLEVGSWKLEVGRDVVGERTLSLPLPGRKRKEKEGTMPIPRAHAVDILPKPNSTRPRWSLAGGVFHVSTNTYNAPRATEWRVEEWWK